ncbi:MAG: 5-demethoxyubiquinol-8 5-hydroxylase UbiM [Pseudomonadota bacterium]
MTKERDAHFDILIVGAGPVGLALSLSLRGQGLRVGLVERQSEVQLESPAYDGRETALSMRSLDILKDLGAWRHLDASEISPLRSAEVTDSHRDAVLHFDPNAVGEDKLGCFVANSNLRRALFSEHQQHGEAELFNEADMVDLRCGRWGGSVVLADRRMLSADLIVAADNRFSRARQLAGIGALKHDYRKTMVISKVELEQPHDQTAWERFLPEGSFALLPLNDQQASIVQTLDATEAERVMALNVEDYLAEANGRIQQRFGAMRSLSKRFTCPLMGVYAHQFTRPGVALAGDAAVGMHPMTAHGFNLGLQGQALLAGEIGNALQAGRDVADPAALSTYQRKHRLLSAGMFFSTTMLAELYATDQLPARMLRGALFDAGRALSPARRFIMRTLTQPLTG